MSNVELTESERRARQAEIVAVTEKVAKAKKEDPLKDILEDLESPICSDNKREEKNTQKYSEKNNNMPQEEKSNANVMESGKKKRSIVQATKNALGNEVVSEVEKQTQRITEAAIRAIALKESQPKTSDKTEDIILQALDLAIDQNTNAMVDAFMLKMQKSIVSSQTKRIDLDELYEEYIKVYFVSEKLKEDEVMFSDGDIIILYDDLEKMHLAASGFMGMPIAMYRKGIKSLVSNNSVAGRVERGAKLYLSYLDNLAIVNIFKEDFLSVF